MIRLFGHYVSKLYVVLGILELGLFYVALLIGFQLGYPGAGLADIPPDLPLFAAAGLFAVILSSAVVAMGLYQRTTPEGSAGLILRLGISLILASMALSLLFYAFQDLFLGRKVVGSALLISFFGVLLLRGAYFRAFGTDSQKHRLLVLGTGQCARQIQMLETPEARFRVVSFVSLGGDSSAVPEDRHVRLDEGGRLLDLAVASDVDEVVVAVDERRGRLPLDELLDCKMNGFPVIDLLTFFEKEACRVNTDLLNPSWIFHSNGFFVGAFAEQWKRALDLLAAVVLLIPGSLLMLVVAAASTIESRGRHPVFFHQTRVGRHGKPFTLHKFRSMGPDAESDGVARWATPGDDRVTPLGRFIRKTRLDELPQLLNVLRGEMSLVGPRPERPEFVGELEKKIPYYAERHRVKPGITGWAQLQYQYGANAEDAKQKLQYDLYYVKNASPFLDLLILLGTVEVILLGKGAR
ncbi:MAG: TIGR03013 family PEP-CTERM/XrtA system glycosyltransferase [Chromatiales bacterium]|jgi:sugar transferase (PEP-CTERM system associated)